MSSQYVFTMHRLSKRYPPDKVVFDDINLSFYPGAKIGVLGYNGSGKSTLLKIMAGLDQDYRGEAQLGTNRTVGLLEQEPQLDPEKDVKGNVEEGVAATKALLDRFNELAANYSDETADEFARLQEQIDAGMISVEDARHSQNKNLVTRALGVDPEVEAIPGGGRRQGVAHDGADPGDRLAQRCRLQPEELAEGVGADRSTRLDRQRRDESPLGHAR